MQQQLLQLAECCLVIGLVNNFPCVSCM